MAKKLLKEKIKMKLEEAEEEINNLNKIIEAKDEENETLKRMLEEEEEVSKNLHNQNIILMNEKKRIKENLNMLLEKIREMSRRRN